MNRFLRWRHSSMIVGTVTSVSVAIAVFAFQAPPVILLPAILIAGTIHFELRSRVIHRLGR